MKVLLPILIIGAAIGLFRALLILKPEPETVEVLRPITSVEVITVQPSSIQLTVKSQGTLLPSVETDLIAEVSGRVIEVADSFRVGNHFRKGDVLLKIDPADYAAVAAARAAEVANAELTLAQEVALSEQAAADWDALGDGEPSELTLRKPQLKQAKAILASAQAALRKANRDLERTQITAPYDGVVLSKNVDLGQFVTSNPGNPISRIYSTQRAEIRLPITEQEAAFLDHKSKRQRFVQLRSSDANSDDVWTARLARIEDNIDPKSRLLYAVAELPTPFEQSAKMPTLRRGTFMKGSIEGRSLQNVYSLPRYALRGSNSLYVLTDDNKLRTREVEIVKSDTEQVIITSGLEPGDRVCISPIAYFVEGMPVQIVDTEANEADKVKTP